MVLNSLSHMYSYFILDYNFHKLKILLTVLMNELQNVDSNLKAKRGADHAALGSFSISKRKDGARKKMKIANNK